MEPIARRTLIGAIAAIPIAAALPALAQPTLRERRSLDDMDSDDDDLLALKEGIRRMRNARDANSLDRQTLLHARYARHGDWLFLPWHRLELLSFEAIIARITDHAAFALPYWDYNQTPQLPDYFFDSADALYRANRKATAETDVAELRWSMNKGKVRFDEDDFATFTGTPGKMGTIEAFGHNLVHSIVGGDMALLSTSPLDPIFYLHHANIDRAWQSWLDLHHGEPIPGEWRSKKLRGFVHPSRRLDGLNAGNTLDCSALGYRYDTLYGAAGTGPPAPIAMPEPPTVIIGPDGQPYTLPPRAPPPALPAPVSFQASARPGADPSTLAIALPDTLLAPVRAGLRLSFTAGGSVTFAYAALNEASLVISGGPPQVAAPASIAAVPTVLHGAHDHRAPSDRPPNYAFLFDESEAIEALIRSTRGPLELSVAARDQVSGAPRKAARALGFDLNLRLDPPE